MRAVTRERGLAEVLSLLVGAFATYVSVKVMIHMLGAIPPAHPHPHMHAHTRAHHSTHTTACKPQHARAMSAMHAVVAADPQRKQKDEAKEQRNKLMQRLKEACTPPA